MLSVVEAERCMLPVHMRDTSPAMQSSSMKDAAKLRAWLVFPHQVVSRQTRRSHWILLCHSRKLALALSVSRVGLRDRSPRIRKGAWTRLYRARAETVRVGRRSAGRGKVQQTFRVYSHACQQMFRVVHLSQMPQGSYTCFSSAKGCQNLRGLTYASKPALTNVFHGVPSSRSVRISTIRCRPFL